VAASFWLKQNAPGESSRERFAFKQLALSNWQLAKNKSNPKGKIQNLTADYADKRGFGQERLLIVSRWSPWL
jgi:hypothetical protein